MTGSAHISYSTGILIGLGGAYGYIKKGSLPSLLAGLGLGSLLILSGRLISTGKNFEGHAVGVLASAAGSGAMLGRAVKTKSIMPAGPVAVILTACGIFNLLKMQEWKPAPAEDSNSASKQE